MKILAVETSCDETAISVIRGRGWPPQFKILAQIVSSQIALHAPFGGVVPNLAKREHSKNLMPVFKQCLRQARLLRLSRQQNKLTVAQTDEIRQILSREPELLDDFLDTIPRLSKPEIDLMAVTTGPGLEPALWVGINFVKALGKVWPIKTVAVNHLEGHIYSILEGPINNKLEFPALALLISGGHTELVLITDWLKYRLLGQTRDDACGEAFDKAARLLNLPYPGGPELEKLAAGCQLSTSGLKLPRPMINSPDFDLSFAGLKTAVLYLIRSRGKLSRLDRVEIAQEFQKAVIEVLLSKTARAADKYSVKAIIVAGGVSANQTLKNAFLRYFQNQKIKILFPPPALTTDNASMIAFAAYIRYRKNQTQEPNRANGALRLDYRPS